jgi:hypothetical protein
LLPRRGVLLPAECPGRADGSYSGEGTAGRFDGID